MSEEIITRGERIKQLKFLLADTKMKLMLAAEDKQQELLGVLREIEMRLFTTRRNKNESKFYKFTPSSEISGNMFNRRERRQMLRK